MSNKPNNTPNKPTQPPANPATPSGQSQQQTLQQRRAKAAWAAIKTANCDHKEYASLVRGFAAMIQTDGLAPALAFIKAKGKDHHLTLNQHLSEWVLAEMKITGEKDLLQWLLGQSSARYRQAATETIAYLVWLKRFVEAEGWT